MPLNNTAKDAMNDELASLVGYLSLHDDDPSTNGANEVSGGSPAYARKAATWAASSGGVVALDDPVGPFDVPASTTVKHVGFWSAATDGTFYGSAPVVEETFAAQGQFTITAGTHTLSDAS